MTEDQLNAHEAKMVKKNALCIVEHVLNKINDEPGPGGCFMQAFEKLRRFGFSKKKRL